MCVVKRSIGTGKTKLDKKTPYSKSTEHRKYHFGTGFAKLRAI